MSDLLLAKRLCSVALTLASVAFVGGCATSSSSGSDTSMADSEAAFGYEQTEWGTPFWERWLEEARAEGRASVARENGQPGVATTDAGGLSNLFDEGVHRAVLTLDSDDRDQVLHQLDEWAGLLDRI